MQGGAKAGHRIVHDLVEEPGGCIVHVISHEVTLAL